MSRIVLRLFSVACGLVLSVPMFAHAYTSPGQPTGFVNDFSNLLSAAIENNLETQLAQFSASTTIEISVVTVKSLDGDSIETYANKLFREWGIGQKETNNGILLLIAPQERKLRIEVGYGLEGAMPDIQAGYIIDNIITPAFKQDNYEGGISSGVNAIISVVQGEIFQISSHSNSSLIPNYLEMFVFVGWCLFVVLIQWLGGLLASTKSWWLGGIIGIGAGSIFGFFFGFLYVGLIICVVLGLIGFMIDVSLSRGYSKYKANGGTKTPWSWGTTRSGRSGGSFGGFGGGSSGGGGASGSW